MALTQLSARTRSQLTALFGERANYVTLKDNTKEPTGTYRQSGKRQARARVLSTPSSGNYGIIPTSDFFILDIDVHKGDFKLARDFFEQFFRVKLAETLSVRTPSGGMHYYLRIPNSQIIFNGSLRPYAKKIAEMIKRDVPVLDADIRSSDAAGYVVGPGSYVSKMRDGAPYPTPGYYTLQGKSRAILRSGDFTKIQEISDSSAAILAELRILQKSKRQARVAANSTEPQVEEITKLIETRAEAATVNAVRRGLTKKINTAPDLEYHRRRAYVSAVMRCCYSDYAIAVACADLEVDKDSYTGRRLSMWQMLEDLHRLRENNPELRHSPYCPVGRAKAQKNEKLTQQKTVEEFLRDAKVKLANRTFAKQFYRKSPKVVHMMKVFARLEVEKKKKIPQVYQDAILLLDLLFQPLMNSGAKKVVVAAAPVTAMLEISKSRLTAALRLLRERKIIMLVNRQMTGFAPTYTVTDDYIHKPLTAAIKYEWIKTKESTGNHSVFIYNRFLSSFVELRTGAIHELEFTVSKPTHPDLNVAHKFSPDLFARKYLHKELT